MNMTRRIRNWVLGLSGVLLLAIVGLAVQRQSTAQNYRQSTTPTLFFHGGGSSYHAETHMVAAARRAGVTHTVVRAMVSRIGKVTMVGQIPKGAINPIVEVNYADNRQLNYAVHGQWATNVVRTLQRRYHFKAINMVGHSLGNMSPIYYLLQHDHDSRLPVLQKQVAIAGHFAGLNFKQVPASIQQPRGLTLDAAGKPNRMNATYRQMTQLRRTLPRHQLRVLNLYGNIGGQTDGTVPNVSSLSLKYLVAKRAQSYTERQITGRLARHSQLHSNPTVDRQLIKFLWQK